MILSGDLIRTADADVFQSQKSPEDPTRVYDRETDRCLLLEFRVQP